MGLLPGDAHVPIAIRWEVRKQLNPTKIMVGGMTVLKNERSSIGTAVPYPNMELARAYIVIQRWGGPLYDLSKALEVGTLFPELWRPYPQGGDRSGC